jgi:RNA polymerase sigma-70 factor (ECF subfamily)
MEAGAEMSRASLAGVSPRLHEPGQPVTANAEDLMSRVQRGDMAAYRELVGHYQAKVFRVIRSFHRTPEDAMEVVQDTFLKLFVARDTWEHRTSFCAWLYRIAINASIDRYRRSDKGMTTSLEDMLEGQVEASAVCRRPEDPLEQVSARERRRILENAIGRLPARQREVISLRYFGEMQLEEIAQVLRCPLGTVKSNLHKAVIGLKGILFRQREALGYE